MNDYAEALAAKPWSEIARKSQLPPERDWRIWLLLGGRGAGKTRAAAEYVTAEAMSGRARHVGVVGRTAADLRDVQVEGPSGLLAVAPAWFRPEYEPTKRRLTWPNGAVASTYSADEPDTLRGPQHDLLWFDELAAYGDVEGLWLNAMLGLRLGQARCVVSTTPRPIAIVRGLVARDGQDVAVTRSTTFENLGNLSPAFAADIVSQFGGTHLGRQELYAEILSDTPGALWTRETLEKTRVQSHPALVRIVVGVDPSAGTSDASGECGIVMAGITAGTPTEAYVVADRSVKASPDVWARSAAQAFKTYGASRVVAERNQGGLMVESVLRTVSPNLSITLVQASVSKQARAEPVAALFEQGRCHIVGMMPELEAQLCSWVPGSGESPDRLDALVWAITELMGLAGEQVHAPAAATYNPSTRSVSGYGGDGPRGRPADGSGVIIRRSR